MTRRYEGICRDKRILALVILSLGILLFLPARATAQDPCSANCGSINLACNNSVNVSINEDCYAAVTTDLILEDPPFEYCPDSPTYFDIEVFDENGNLIPGHIIGEEHVGQQLKASITLIPCSISCWGYINVEDKVGPKIWGCVDGFLPPVILDCDDYGNGIGPGYPEVTGLCDLDESRLFYSDDTSAVRCNNGYAVRILRSWTAIDESGFRDQCQQEILVEKQILKNIVFPDDFIVEATGDCSVFEDISPERTGFPDGVFCPNIQFYYNDIEYPQCGLQRKLLREWFVIDWCTGESVSRGQIIKIIDDRSPVVMCPPDTVWYPQDYHKCITDVVLDPYGLYDTLTRIKVLDECSQPISVTVEYRQAEAGHVPDPVDNYYPVEMNPDSTFTIPGIEESVWVRYCYSDACGNRSGLMEDMPELIDSMATSACCVFEVGIEDQHPPTAICEGYTKVQLTSTGVTEIFAETFDDGSFDFCNDIDYFEVKRENTSCPGFNEHGNNGFGPSVHFCCQDLGQNLTVRLRVYDLKGNFGECLGIVKVHSHATPRIECPADVTLNCGDDYQDRDLIGIPTAENGCESGTRIGQDWFDIQDFDILCGTGTIIRTVDVLDDAGNVLQTCSQEIFIDPASKDDALMPGDFEFPVDVTIDECTFGQNIHPDFTGKPETSRQFDCSNIAISYKDDPPLQVNNNGICFKVLRRWKVVDWCRFNPSRPDDNTLTAVQEISIRNSAVAKFSCPQDITVSTNSPNCEAFVDLEVSTANICPATFTISWEIDAFSNGTVDYVGNGTNASDIFPAGKHLITYKAVNHCGGNVTSCTFQFTVEANKAPIPICRSELIWTITSNQQALVWASDFDLKSVGGCDPSDILEFSFVSPEEPGYPEISRMFSCTDIPDGISESIEMDIYVVDEAGAYSSCNVTLHLQDNHNFCPDAAGMATVGGKIMTEMHEPLDQVMVELKNMGSESSAMEMTGFSGSYAFENVEMYGHYEVAPFSNVDPANGVSTLDLLLIQKHILGQSQLDSPYKLIAADVDGNNQVSAIDLIQLRKLILGIFEEFPANDSWVFLPEEYKFSDPLAPWDYPNSISLAELHNSEMEADFVGVKIGDVNNSHTLDQNIGGAARSHKNSPGPVSEYFLSAPQAQYKEGELVSVPVQLGENMAFHGFQFTISFDEKALLFEGLDRGALDIGQEHFALLNNREGTITISYDAPELKYLGKEDVLFTIYFEARQTLETGDVFDINSSFIPAEIYTEDFRAQPLDFVLLSQAANDVALEVFQNEPNPFDESTSIAFSIPERQTVALSIFDAGGRVIYQTSGVFNKGIHAFRVESSELPVHGVLFYRVEGRSSLVTRKMIVVK